MGARLPAHMLRRDLVSASVGAFAGAVSALAAVAVWDRIVAARSRPQPTTKKCGAAAAATKASAPASSLPQESHGMESPDAGQQAGVVAAGAQQQHTVEIEYCVGCRWMLRAAWVAQE